MPVSSVSSTGLSHRQHRRDSNSSSVVAALIRDINVGEIRDGKLTREQVVMRQARREEIYADHGLDAFGNPVVKKKSVKKVVPVISVRPYTNIRKPISAREIRK